MMASNTVIKVCEQLNSVGFKGFLVGGSIRDILLNVPVHDIDITTDAKPCQIKSCFWLHKQFNLGEKFGTITVLFNGEKVEITTFRTESEFTSKRNELNVSFVTSLEEDLKRRDLTVNALALNPLTGELIDLFGGKNDLDNHIIRFVGNAEERIIEDPLRMLRAIRFASKLNSVIEPISFNAIKTHALLIRNVAFERIKEELFKILSIEDCSLSLLLLEKTGLLMAIIPELAKLSNVEQPKKFHKWNVLHHSFMTVLEIPANKPLLRFAGLLHDIGKTECRTCSPFFPSHEIKGIEIFKVISRRFKLSVEEEHFISFIISNHMIQFGFRNIENNKSAMKRLLSNMGENIRFLEDLFIMFEADKVGTGREDPETTERTKRVHIALNEILANKEPLQVKDLNINGKELLEINIPASKIMGDILNKLLEKVLDNSIPNDKEALLKEAKTLYLSNL